MAWGWEPKYYWHMAYAIRQKSFDFQPQALKSSTGSVPALCQQVQSFLLHAYRRRLHQKTILPAFGAGNWDYFDIWLLTICQKALSSQPHYKATYLPAGAHPGYQAANHHPKAFDSTTESHLVRQRRKPGILREPPLPALKCSSEGSASTFGSTIFKCLYYKIKRSKFYNLDFNYL